MRSLEPNGYYLPEWAQAVSASARGRTGASAIAVWSNDPFPAQTSGRLIGLLPAISFWRAFRIPLPALVSAYPYGTLCTPLLDRNKPADAAARLLQTAREAGARALILRDVMFDGEVMKTITGILRQDGMRPRVLRSYSRACLDATRDADALLHEALGAGKLKELRRQRNRLADHGEVRFDIARSPEQVSAALEHFLKLEAGGWKGRRGTALVQDDGDASFIRQAAPKLAETGQCEIVSLRTGDIAIAAAVVLRHLDRAFYFKLGFDEQFAKFSPGVQLTLDLTQHLCADPGIALANSTAGADNSMINPIWRERRTIGDVLIPLRPNDPVVSLIHAAWSVRHQAETTARRGIHFIRKFRAK